MAARHESTEIIGNSWHTRSLDAGIRAMAHRKHNRPAQRPLGGVSGPQQLEERDGQEYFVRAIPGQNATKPYTCPQCLDRIAVSEPHLVVWPANEDDGVGQRRHWHTRCWRRGQR